jgi:hypothetical protein
MNDEKSISPKNRKSKKGNWTSIEKSETLVLFVEI